MKNILIIFKNLSFLSPRFDQQIYQEQIIQSSICIWKLFLHILQELKKFLFPMRMGFFLFTQTNQFILLISQVNNADVSWLVFNF